MTKLVTLLVVVVAADLRRRNAARILGGAGDRHHRGHLFVDLHLRRARPRSRAATDDLLERKLTKPEEIDGLP